jgi:hypothetical protein
MPRYGKTLKEQLGVSDDKGDRKVDDSFERPPLPGHWSYGAEPPLKISPMAAYVLSAVVLIIALGLLLTGSWIKSIISFVVAAWLVIECRPGGFFYEKKDH